MREHSDTTDGDATVDGGSAWARLALSLADRGDRDDGGPGLEQDAPPSTTAGADPGAWGLIGSALHPAADEPEVDEAPTSAWSRVAGALGSDQPSNIPLADAATSPGSGKRAAARTVAPKTAGPKTAGPKAAGQKAAGSKAVARPGVSPAEARAEARRRRAEAAAGARRQRAESRAEARRQRVEAKAEARRRRAVDVDELDVDELDVEELDVAGLDVAGLDDDAADEGQLEEDDRQPGRFGAGVGRALSTGRRRGAAAAVVVVVVAAALVVGLVVLPGGGLPAGTAFRVQGQDTSVGQLDAQVTVLNALYGVTVPSRTAPGYSVFEKTEAKALAVSKLIDRLAASRGLTVPAKTARTALDNYINQNYGGNQTTFATALGNAGLNQDELLTELTHQAVVQKLFAAVVGNAPTVTAAQVDAYFQAHTAALATQETRAVSSIVVATQAQAQAIVSDLEAGQSFATLASQQSLDSSTKANGGVLGTLGRNQLDTAFGQAAFAATVNSPFGPVKDNGHWYVGLVTKVTPAAAATNNTRTQAAIRTYLQDQAQLARWDSYLSREIRAAHITYAPAYQPSNPFQPPQTPLPTLTGASIAAASTSGSTPTAGSAVAGGTSGTASGTAP